MIRKNDFPALTEELQDIFEEHSAQGIADAKGFELFNVLETDQYNYLHQILHGVNGIREVGDGEDYPRVNSKEGDNITYSQRQFGGTVAVTKKMRKFDMYGKIRGMVESIVDAAWNNIDQSMADSLLYGWSTSFTDIWGESVSSVGPDGVEMFSASHTNGATASTYSNIISDGTNNNPALSRAAIVYTIRTGKVYKDVNGLIRPVRLDTLIVSPNNEDLAYRIVYSDKINGTPNNDTNQHMQRIKKIIVWERLEVRSDGTDTSEYWFLADSSKVSETLKLLFSERPGLDAPQEVHENKDWEYVIDFFYTYGIGFAAFIFGSNGTGS